MNHSTLLLGIALGLQLVLAGSLYLAGQEPVADSRQTTLITLSKQDIQQVSISEGEGSQAAMQKSDGRWILTDYFQLPVSTAKLDTMLAKLVDTTSGWPVTTTTSGHQRFKVADGEYNKKIVLTAADGQSETLYLGTSPGFRQLHVRRADENDVYAVKLNSFDFPPQDSDWLDKTLLQIKDEITHVSGNDYSLQKQGDAWIMENSDGNVDKTEVNVLINALKQLRVTQAEERSLDDSAHELTVKAGDKSYRYRLSEVNDGYLVKRDDWQAVFRLSESEYENLALHKASTLVEFLGAPEQEEASNNEPEESTQATNESTS